VPKTAADVGTDHPHLSSGIFKTMPPIISRSRWLPWLADRPASDDRAWRRIRRPQRAFPEIGAGRDGLTIVTSATACALANTASGAFLVADRHVEQ